MIHEEQVRQLCAIHTVNNLLQLSAELDAPTSQTATTHEWKCHGRIITNTNKDWQAANQEEFDNIAKELTLREQILMSGDESTFLSSTSSKEETSNSVSSSDISQTKFGRLSMLQRVRSQHGTPFFGNYSVDVIREALKRRGVELEFYRVPTNDNNAGHTAIRKNKTNEDGDVKDDTRDTTCLLGLVVYEKEEQQTNAMLSFLTRIGSHIPIVKNFCGVGQHWYAVTGVRYTSKNASEGKSDTSSGQEDTDSSWHVIDSKTKDITTFGTDDELFDYAREIQDRGGIIFRAFFIGTDER